MRPHELANQILQPKEKVDFEFPEITSLINSVDGIESELKTRKFEESEEGHIRLEIPDYAFNDSIEVIFVDPLGSELEIGRIQQDFDNPEVGRAYAVTEVGHTWVKSEPIAPSDERWDVIVGTIQRAVVEYQSILAEPS